MNENNDKTVSSYSKIFQEKLKKEDDLKNNCNIIPNIKDELKEEKNFELNNNSNDEEIKKGINFDNLGDWENVVINNNINNEKIQNNNHDNNKIDNIINNESENKENNKDINKDNNIEKDNSEKLMSDLQDIEDDNHYNMPILQNIENDFKALNIRTVDVHIRRIREKLEQNPASPEYIMTKWGVGYYFKA